MNMLAKKMAAYYQAACRKLYITSKTLAEDHGQVLLFALGVALLIGGISDIALADTKSAFNEDTFRDGRISGAVCLFFRLIEGAFGALIMVVAGLAAIIAAAMGAYRAAMGMLVVAVGAFILRALVSLFFDTTDFATCSGAAPD